MKFKVGDRVICTGGRWYDDVEGIPGTVVCSNKYYSRDVGIKFDRKVKNGQGHDLYGLLNEKESRLGYFIEEDDLKLIKDSNIGGY